MGRYAYVEGGAVTRLVAASYVPEGAGWVAIAADADVAIGDTYDGSVFTRPAPQPEPARMRLSRREFRNQFTFAEKQAIYTAKASSVDVEIFLDDLVSVDYVDLDDTQTIASVNSLETAGLIASGRAAEILTGL